MGRKKGVNGKEGTREGREKVRKGGREVGG